MATEPPTAGFINSLDPANPIDDNFVYGADDWFRFVQDVLKVNQFPISEDGSSNGWDIAVTVKASEVNALEGISNSETVQEQLDAITARLDKSVPVGSIVPWPVSETPPSKYLSTDSGSPGEGEWWICDGLNIDGTTYTEIFARIGNTYGGTDATTMLLPDIQGRTIAGRSVTTSRLTGYRQGADDTAQGNTGGEDAHTPIQGEMFSHDHGGGDHSHLVNHGGTGNSTVNAGEGFGNVDSAFNNIAVGLSTATSGGYIVDSGDTISSQGSSENSNVTQPTIIMAMYIRVL